MDRRKFLQNGGIMAIGASVLGLQSTTLPHPYGERGVFNVVDFGAKGDGKTSDSKAIQTAIDEAAKVKGCVWFPPGIYPCHDIKVAPYVALVAEPVWLYRIEKVGAVLQLDNPNATCLLDITGAFGVHIRGLMLNGIYHASKEIHGIYQYNPEKWSEKEDSFVFDEIKVSNFSGHGIYLKRTWLFIIRHSHFFVNKHDGVRIHGWDGFVTDNQFSGNGGNGFGCEECGATVMFTANRVEWNHKYGLYICNGDDWNITGNSFDRNWGAGLCIENGMAIAATGNVFRRCGKDSNLLNEGERSCQVRLEKCSGLTMTGNACLAGRDDGGKGLFTPQVGFIYHNMQYSIISNNTLWEGYMEDMVWDLGEHGKEFIVKDNVGCPKRK